MAAKRNTNRSRQVGDMIQQTLAQILLQEMSDDRFRMVTVVSATASKDLSSAKVYVSVLSDDEAEIKRTVQLLNQSAKSLRYELGRRMTLRIVPELKFVYDDSLAHGFKISSLINEAVKKSEK